ncbi:WUSCHEL-related homeobox 9 [Macadamia integrifolia]|uniref:WUSCHEL-related homeobox 9 n=1 Tax=Macadamia integrifolia TaxID=60698 RepID=UPI001C4F6C59|nr:WUSCHEL-related homeobox 9 [Macadamia integrifolia]
MASSNRNWPSMFKSKTCNTHNQWQHDINPPHLSSGSQRNPYTSVPSSEERSPEPKPRWNPKPEQIRILEAIFNSGMVNPPRDEIRKIRAQLQEYGQVGDANVFYWFQNRKSRSKHKQRHLQSVNVLAQSAPTTTGLPLTVQTIAAPSSSSSSSSEKSPPRRTKKKMAMAGVGGGGGPNPNVIDPSNSPYHGDLSSEPFFFPVQPPTFSHGHGFCFSDLSNLVQYPDQAVGPCSADPILSEVVNQGAPKKDEQAKMQLDQQLSYAAATTTTPSTNTITSGSTTLNQIHGGVVGVESGSGSGMAPAAAAKSTVFIDDVAFEVTGGPVNVRETFGDDAVLIHSSGQPVLTNEWGVTLQSLQHGAFYYLVWENGR